MSDSLVAQTPLVEAVAALRRDLLADGGAQISTMRNYRFAILPYHPAQEFDLRKHVRRLADELRADHWSVLQVALDRLLLDRLRATGREALDALIAREKRLATRGADRALAHLQEKVAPHVEGPDGLAADVARIIAEFADAPTTRADRALVLLGRLGGLYPFFRSSALLKHIDGKTRNVPVVLLYPGERRDTTALSFMGELPADRDYRPRIYP